MAGTAGGPPFEAAVKVRAEDEAGFPADDEIGVWSGGVLDDILRDFETPTISSATAFL